MQYSSHHLSGVKLNALDGDIGHVKDFYFDDQDWVMRYLVVETGSWLSDRQVLLSPHVLGALDQSHTHVHVNLTRKQIEDSPSIESHLPVSRQFEEAYYRYYGWPFYWQGDALWGMSSMPIAALPAIAPPIDPAFVNDQQREPADAHLWSTRAVSGYHIQAYDGTAGHICDFMIDDQNWAIPHVVVKTIRLFWRRYVLIPTSAVNRVNYEKSVVSVHLTCEDVEQSPARHATPAGAVK